MPDNDPDDPEANDTLTTDTEVMDTPTDAVEAPLEPGLEPELESELEADLAADPDPDPEAEAEGEPGDYEEEFVPPAERPGDWYVVHTYAGYENKVKANLDTRIRSMNMEDKIFEVVIPIEDVIEFKSGKKQVVQKRIFPGYLMVRMYVDDDSWYVVRNTPGVTGFVGPRAKPVPLSRREVEDILGVAVDDETGAPTVE